MLRQLLTLLAVITGLGLSAGPAVAAHDSVISIAAAGETADCQPVVQQPLQLSVAADRQREYARPCDHRPVIVYTPTVQLQVDRARE